MAGWPEFEGLRKGTVRRNEVFSRSSPPFFKLGVKKKPKYHEIVTSYGTGFRSTEVCLNCVSYHHILVNIPDNDIECFFLYSIECMSRLD